MKRSGLFTLLAFAVLFLALVPVGTAVFVLGFFNGDSPCILCWEQRIGMALVALIGLFVLRYGAKPRYLGLAVLVGAYGVFMGIRHSSLHLARDIGQGFSIEILGAHTYTWSFFIFWCSVIVIGALLMMAKDMDLVTGPVRTLRRIDTVAMVVFLSVATGNIVQAFASTGPPPFVGQSDPIRFSFNPRNWVWSMEEYAGPVSLRGRWGVAKPDGMSVDRNPASGPLKNLPQLAPSSMRALELALRGTPTGLAYDAATDRFLVTTQEGVYITNGTLDRVVRSTVVDPAFSVDLGRFADAAFLNSPQVIAVTENKSYVVLREDANADARANYRYFLEPGQFDEVTRSRFTTVRAKMMYILSAAVDQAGKSIYTITVPNARTQRMIVSRFDTDDMQLSEEFAPTIAPGVPFAPADPNARPLDHLYVTGATFAGGKLLALSAAGSMLITIDPAAHRVVAAHVLSGLAEPPVGIAVKGPELFVLTRRQVFTYKWGQV
jgi:disulfide bond formation protein DsbB